MGRYMYTENVVRENFEFFYSVQEAEQIIRDKLGEEFDESLYRKCKNLLLFVFVSGSPISRDPKCKEKYQYIYKTDLEICTNILLLNRHIDINELNRFGCNGDLFSSHIKMSKETFLIFKEETPKKQIPAFVRNMFYFSTLDMPYEEDEEISQFDLFGISLLTKDKYIKDYMIEVEGRRIRLISNKQSAFTTSASYMGNKKKIVGFIIESMMPYIKGRPIFVDLMCGSGVVTNAFAELGNTYASDAQAFCCLLAKIQGGGYSYDRANEVLKKILYNYEDNYALMSEKYATYLQEEDAIFHMDYSNMEDILNRYLKFVRNYPLYSSNKDSFPYIDNIVADKRKSLKQMPYCLFTIYFANVYFGVEQCVQLDSLRYAVDQISDAEDRDWALGVLIVVTYQIATGYAGHFAQPKKLTLSNIKDVLQKRQMSAKLEFSKRFLSLAEESSKCSYKINIVDGPWEHALKEINQFVPSNAVVYLDAPYKRDEYSRYYHVLETMIKYNYPSSENKGRICSKNKGERFATEFFTKSVNQVEDILTKIIVCILEQNEICVWSYSNNAMASIVKVISEVKGYMKCNVYIYGTYHKHKSQRSKTNNNDKEIEVIEYSIIFTTKFKDKDNKKM